MTDSLRTALVAVHDTDVRLAIRWALDRAGYVVRTATHFAAARELVPGDVLFADLDLGRRSAFELLQVFQHRGYRPHAVLLTDALDEEDVVRALEMGVRGWLRTPIEGSELERLIANLSLAAESAEDFVGVYESSSASTARAPRDVAAFALRNDVGPAGRARIAGACADLVENVERHAYPGSSGPVEVRARCEEGQLELTVSDDGIGFDPVLVTTGCMSRSLDGGLARCTALSESLQIESSPGEGATARATFAVSSTRFDEGPLADLSDLDYLSPESVRQVLKALEHEHAAELFHLSPALAVIVGRLLVGPDPRRALQMAMWS